MSHDQHAGQVGAIGVCRCGTSCLAASYGEITEWAELHLQTEGDAEATTAGDPHVVFTGKPDQIARIPAVPKIEWENIR